MRSQFLLTLAAATLAAALPRTASIYIEPVLATDASTSSSPTLLAEISYDTADPSVADVSLYEAPELPELTQLVRIGLYDPAAGRWESSVSAASPDNFGKGLSPHFVLTVDAKGHYLGAAVRGVRIDAGQTRDFGPQAKVVVSGPGKQPELNKPVVLSPEGKKVVQEEKTLLQRYWWVLLAIGFLVMSGGGEPEK